MRICEGGLAQIFGGQEHFGEYPRYPSPGFRFVDTVSRLSDDWIRKLTTLKMSCSNIFPKISI